MFKKYTMKFFVLIITVFLMIIMITESDICTQGVFRGFSICVNVIIPSLFPFMVCVTVISKLLSKVKIKVGARLLLVFIFSALGGYPIGCKMIDELVVQNNIDLKTANIMQMYCVNAGPAFVITAIGNGIFGSKKAGVVLFVSHIIASVLIMLFTIKYIKIQNNNSKNRNLNKKRNINLFEIFTDSVNNSLGAILNICAFIVLFSVINSYLVYYFKNTLILKNIIFFTEITTGISYTDNIIFISFLLGFSGISIWCQLFSVSANAKPNFKLFALGRILHGTFSGFITYLIIKFFKIKTETVSNNKLGGYKIFYNNITLSLSLLIMTITFLIYLFSKNNSGKMIDDMI